MTSAAIYARVSSARQKKDENQTRPDGRFPVTLRTANQVKSVLRFCPADDAVATRYAHYM